MKYQRKLILLLICCMGTTNGAMAYTMSAFARNIGVTDTIASSHHLKEVVITSDYLKREADHILAIPTAEQRKHANNGYDFIRNLMIPGVNVDRNKNIVTTPVGGATLYINGREVDSREIMSLRPKDIKCVEYYDMPTGKYAKDAAAINIVLKEQLTGGYTQVDAKQGLGFLSGNYNLISKYVIRNSHINLWAGYDIQSPKGSSCEEEDYTFPDYHITRSSTYPDISEKHINRYVQASFSNQSPTKVWMVKIGLSHNNQFDYKDNGMLEYADHISELSETGSEQREKSVTPSLYLYSSWTLKGNQYIDAVYNGYYSWNRYAMNMNEEQADYSTDVSEKYLYSKWNVNYTKELKHHNMLTMSMYEFLRISEADYSNSAAIQHLRSSETILFADYNQRIGQFMYDINPGLSYLSYRLRGDKEITHLTPRLQFSASYKFLQHQLLRLDFALGNTYPNLNTVNRVDQQVNRLLVKRGNPDMDNSILLFPRITYNVNFPHLSLSTSARYTYLSNAVVGNYYAEGDRMVYSFRSDVRSHTPAVTVSATYKPSQRLNLKIDGSWEKNIVNGGIHITQETWAGSMSANLFMNDFALSASLETPKHALTACQYIVKSDWQYDLSLSWNHQNWGMELNMVNPLLRHCSTVTTLCSNVYASHTKEMSDQNNQYVTFKVVYNLEYGKKTSKSPAYNHTQSESAILKS